MATRSTIALEFADGSVSQVYCHWDGYLDGAGATLATHWTDAYKLRDLIDQGDLSSLGIQVGQAHPFSMFELKNTDPDYAVQQALHELSEKEEWTTFYARDRREEGCTARRYMNADEYFDTCQQEEYDYILRNVNGVATWFVRCYATDGVWATLAEAKALQEECAE